MFGEKAARRSAAPISSATEWKRFLKISRRVGSNRKSGLFCMQDEIPITIYAGPPARRYERCGTVFDHDGRASKAMAGAELRAVVDGSSEALQARPREDRAALGHDRPARVGR